MTRIMECQDKACKFTWMAKSADYCPRCKGTELGHKAEKVVEVREKRAADDGPVAEGTPGSVPSKDES